MFLADKLNKGGSLGGYQISRSLRFNAPDTTYLTRTPSTASNRRTWTWSGWVKRGLVDTNYRSLFSSVGASDYIQFKNDCTLVVSAYNGVNYVVSSTAIYRDPSAWYHIVVGFDSTQATASNRIKMYVNGSEITSFYSTSYPTQNYDTDINNTVAQYIGTNQYNYFDGYMTEVNFIDGQQLTPSSFGETNAQTGVWQPKAYSGSYGTNGFYLNFSDNSNTTAATLGKDYSGNGNNWTPNNFSVTAGAGNDSLVDSPTSYGTDTGVGGTVRGNYCTLNPLTTTSGTYVQGNLQFAGANSWRRSNATISRTTGQWYWEVTLANAPYPIRANGEWNAFGFGLATTFNSTDTPPLQTDAIALTDSGYYKNFSGSYTDTGVAFSSGDVLSIAVDLDANTFTFRRNNTSLATGTIGGTAGRELVPIIISYSNAYGLMDCNFGQRPFAYTAPSGYKALCTQNLPTPTIGATTATQANKYFDVVLRNGGGASGGTYSTTVNMSNGALLWDKPRSTAFSNFLTDSVRGLSKNLSSNQTAAEVTDANFITTFGSSSFSTGSSDWGTSTTIVDWIWAANGSGSTNTSGSITSTVSANTTSGFSIVTYSGQSAAGTIGHGLGVAPSWIIVKNRSSASPGAWTVYSSYLGNTSLLFLNTTDGVFTGNTAWNSTSPTSSVFSVGPSSLSVNTVGNNFVAYCFAPVAGYSAMGSYTGNNSSDGPFTFTGFRVGYVMIKRTDTSGYNWIVYDATRDPYNVAGSELLPNTADAEATYPILDFLSNGFKIRISATSVNASGGTYIFMAFASNPFKYSLAR